jgi:hypothetical protein
MDLHWIADVAFAVRLDEFRPIHHPHPEVPAEGGPRRVASGTACVPGSCPARDQEKWIPVFRPIARQSKISITIMDRDLWLAALAPQHEGVSWVRHYF